jgi:peptidoglycan/LPS O-acetylase OafA/YrhL
MILPLIVATYLVGMLLFLIKAFWGINDWIYGYFAWEKAFGGGFLVWYLIAKYSRQRRMVIPIVWLSFSRFLWEIICWVGSFDFNNKWGVLVLFSMFTLVAAYACLRKESKIAKFLDKNVP